GFGYLERYPDDYALSGLLGVSLMRHGLTNRGMELVKVGILADKPEREVALYMAMNAQSRGDIYETRRYLELELKHWPGNNIAARMLVALLVPKREWQAQAAVAEAALAADDSDLLLWHAQAQALFNLGLYDESREVLGEALKRDQNLSILLLLDANLLAKEGKMEAAQVRFEEAKSRKAEEDAFAMPRQ
ncbi:MAG: hypothetical protein HN348_04175, partial [Proteobacteria bacterium]|nr:hypothetical protein [Pseudomonadota bacterium]